MFATALRSKAVRWIGLGWSAFIAENVVLSENREYIIANFGDANYHNLYNTLSTAACGSIAWGYFKYGRKKGPMLSSPRSKLSVACGSLLFTLGLMGLSQIPPKLQMPVTFKGEKQVNSSNNGQVQEVMSAGGGGGGGGGGSTLQVRCPMDFKSGEVPPGTIYGLDRISRHATFWSLGICCAGVAMTTVFVSEIVMFTFPLVFALIGTEHQDSRYRRGSGGSLSVEKEKQTSNIPFAAVLRGEQSLSDVSREMKWSNALIAASAGLMFLMRKL